MFEKKWLKNYVSSDGKYAIKGNLLSRNRITNVRKCTLSEREFFIGFYSTNCVSNSTELNHFNVIGSCCNKIICHPVLNELNRDKTFMYKQVRRYPIDNDEQDSRTKIACDDDDDLVVIGPRYGGIPRMRKNQTPCEYLNQFSSVFVDNLKDPIPKDPLTRPRAYNNYHPPRKQVKTLPVSNHDSGKNKKNYSDVRYVVDDKKSSEHEKSNNNYTKKTNNCSNCEEKYPVCSFCCFPWFFR